MAYAGITGWGKCLPHGVLTNADLASFLDTSDDWIVSPTVYSLIWPRSRPLEPSPVQA